VKDARAEAMSHLRPKRVDFRAIPTPASIAARDPWEECSALTEVLDSGWRTALGVWRKDGVTSTHPHPFRWLLEVGRSQPDMSITNCPTEMRANRAAVWDHQACELFAAAEVELAGRAEALAFAHRRSFTRSSAGADGTGRMALRTVLQRLGLVLWRVEVRPSPRT
jgi:hypothetical protein